MHATGALKKKRGRLNPGARRYPPRAHAFRNLIYAIRAPSAGAANFAHTASGSTARKRHRQFHLLRMLFSHLFLNPRIFHRPCASGWATVFNRPSGPTLSSGGAKYQFQGAVSPGHLIATVD